jgi:hypothetical protein
MRFLRLPALSLLILGVAFFLAPRIARADYWDCFDGCGIVPDQTCDQECLDGYQDFYDCASDCAAEWGHEPASLPDDPSGYCCFLDT